MEPFAPPAPTLPATRYSPLPAAKPAPAPPLDLLALHAQLLPLAQAAGHARLVLRAEVGAEPGYLYEAYGAGGSATPVTYISFGTAPSQAAAFVVTLETRLNEQVAVTLNACAQL